MEGFKEEIMPFNGFGNFYKNKVTIGGYNLCNLYMALPEFLMVD
jgi:hypothetical protein